MVQARQPRRTGRVILNRNNLDLVAREWLVRETVRPIAGPTSVRNILLFTSPQFHSPRSPFVSRRYPDRLISTIGSFDQGARDRLSEQRRSGYHASAVVILVRMTDELSTRRRQGRSAWDEAEPGYQERLTLPILGAHMSIAGGYWKAVEAAANVDADCVQVFTKNNNRWRGSALSDGDCEKFQAALQQHGIQHTLSHASYLINLASNKEELLEKSIDAMVDELQRADRLGIPHVVFHPGSHTTSTPEEGLATIVDSLKVILQRTSDLTTFPLLENTAGQGSNLGFEFEQLGDLIDQVNQPERVGVCIDTCHTFAAGYSMANEEDYETTIQQMDSTFGIGQIKAIHLNDSKRPFASRKDRHEHIGQGEMGDEPFRLLVNDPRFAETPMYLETEKGEIDGKDMDEMNLERLRSLVS